MELGQSVFIQTFCILGKGPNIAESPADPNKARPRARGVDFPLRVLVSSDMVGAIIGRGGSTIRNITQQSRARVDVHR